MRRAAALLLLLAACTHDNGGAVSPKRTTTSTPVTSTSTTASLTPTLAGAATSPVSTPPGADRGLLTAVRVDHQPGFDRVVFELSGATPGYGVRYIQPPIRADASGEIVPVAGNAFVQVRLEDASTVDLSGGTPRTTYGGPNRVRGSTNDVIEVVKAGDFEGVLTWVIGVRTRTPFRVTTLSGPPRVVVDLQG